MKHSLATITFMVVLIQSRPASAAEGTEPLLTEGVWVMKYDDKLDAKVESKPDSDVRWKLTVSKDKVSGSLANARGHSLAGEVVQGKPPIIFLRQEGPRGLVCYYSGKLVEKGKGRRHLVRQPRWLRRL
jgi:hypothetical protein